jgi:nitroreductase
LDLHTLLHTRRTIHRYLPDPLPPEVLERALAAAHMAPCHRLTWPWRFRVLGPAARERLIPIAVAEKARKAPVSDEQQAAIAAAYRTPPALVLVTSARSAKPEVERENYAATATAIQNLMLAAHADGFGTKWSTGGPTKSPDTYAAFQIDPAVEEIVGMVWMGRAADVPTIPRPPVADHVQHLP